LGSRLDGSGSRPDVVGFANRSINPAILDARLEVPRPGAAKICLGCGLA
jgi:hypothetical protein